MLYKAHHTERQTQAMCRDETEKNYHLHNRKKIMEIINKNIQSSKQL